MVEPFTTCIEQLIVRLDKFGLVKPIPEDPIAVKLVFFPSNVLIWTKDLSISTLNVNLSSEGSE